MRKRGKVQVKSFHLNLHTTHCFNVLSKPHFIDLFNLQYQKDRKTSEQIRSHLVFPNLKKFYK